MSIIPIVQGGHSVASGFDTTLIGNSIWLEGERTTGQFAEGTWGSESNQDRWIFATWVHLLRVADATSNRSAFFGSGTAANGIYVRFVNSPDTATLQVFTRDNAGNEGNIYSTEKFRDLTSWIHVLVDYDSANAVANDRVSLYVNGVRTGTTNGSRPGQNNHVNTNVSGQTFRVGADSSTTADYRMKGYLAQTVFLDNKSIVNGDLATTDFLDTFAFGTNGSQIIPKADADIIALASAAGNNSFCLDYSNSSSGTSLVADASSKGNNLTTSTIASANQSLHSPSKVYATWNALDSALNGHNTDMTLSDGGTVTEDGNGAFCRSTFAIPEGLFSYRVTVDDSTSNQMFGVALNTATDRANGNTNHPNMYAVNTGNGEKNTNGTGSSQYSAWSDGDTMEVYVSRSGTAYKVWYGKNGTLLNGASGSQGDPSAGTNELFSFTHTGDVFFSADYTNPGTKKATTDFGQRGYTPAENALTLSTPNIPSPTHQGIDRFNTVLYTGNGTAIGSGGKAVTGTGFQPDWVWLKNRDAADDHALYDIARGVTKQWESNTNTTASTESEGLTTFGSDGFTVGSLDQVNTNTEDYVSWNWLASNSTSTTSPAGTIASTSSVSSSGHFSVGTYTGTGDDNATVGHGLGGIPELIIVRNLSRSTFGLVWHTDGGGATHTADFAVTATFSANSTKFGGSDASNPTANVFKIGTHNEINASGESFVFYALRSISGLCKVSSYEGNASSDGVYISLGFKPRFFLVKNLDTAGQDWRIYDAVIEPINPNDQFFKANDSAAQISSSGFDFLSDGVKARDNNAGFNAAATYVYLAMADIAGGGTLPPIYGR